ncbi:MAG TPA: serine/threonine-protein kinase [Vicinamibacterales bacterium]|nr:serine/threonine-protein kinase [Vicinamibacterales bacterium]
MTLPVDDRPRRTHPDRIGRYEVIDRIGRGAMGVVYRAHDKAMGRDVALKVLTADLEDDPDIRTRFHREAEAAARLSHPNIITIFDVGEDGDRFFIVMELLRGATLREFLKQNDASLPRKLDLMVQLCNGLSSAHNASIYHRDIKPGNIFVRSDGILKILDFGVARLASSSMTAAGFIVGTPDYMSPEQARGENIDGRSDIFSLGGVFYFMLTGRKPFPATELPGLFGQIQNDDPARLLESEAPPELAAVIMKALAKKADARYQSCQDLLDDLESVRHRYPLSSQRAAAKLALATSAAGAVAVATVEPPAVLNSPAAVVSPSTDDTVDALPAGVFNSDDTVTLKAPTWMQRVTGRLDSAMSGAFARVKRSAAQHPPAPTGVRKR